MGQDELYKRILKKRKKGQTVSDKEKSAVEDLMKIDGKISAYKSEKDKIDSHSKWLGVKIQELENEKQDILDGFASGEKR